MSDFIFNSYIVYINIKALGNFHFLRQLSVACCIVLVLNRLQRFNAEVHRSFAKFAEVYQSSVNLARALSCRTAILESLYKLDVLIKRQEVS